MPNRSSFVAKLLQSSRRSCESSVHRLSAGKDTHNGSSCLTWQQLQKQCVCSSQSRVQLRDGWKAFAQHWGLGRGEQIQLSRRFVSSGCIWLDVQFVQEAAAHIASGMPSSDVKITYLLGRPWLGMYSCISVSLSRLSRLVFFLWLWAPQSVGVAW